MPNPTRIQHIAEPVAPPLGALVLFHKGGVRACGLPAVYVRRFHPLTRPIPADNVIKLDGSVPGRGDLPVCGSCQQPLWRMDDWAYGFAQVLRGPDPRPLTLLDPETIR